MRAGLVLIAVGLVLLIVACVLCLVSAASTQDRAEAAEATSIDDLMAVADAVQDIDEPVPFVPADWPTTEPDRIWLHTIGVKA